ncbi:hypothetical protein [Persephonella sp. KM09-Lau-8]|uniref:hypothetical protein n=1 Tax=Persephonella sp. KM09-Lau-8 TaxID=1158345 RepID=UPI000495C44B|nr:hypothetical protein [Persephonella sp. KM09-Lau-8]
MKKREREKLAYKTIEELIKQGVKIEDISSALEKLQRKEKRKNKELQMREYIFSVALSHYRRTGERIETNRIIYFLEKFWGFNPTTMKKKKETIKIINEEIGKAKNRYYYERKKEKKLKKEILEFIEKQVADKNLSPTTAEYICSRFLKESPKFENGESIENNTFALFITLDKIGKLNRLINSYMEEIKTRIGDKEKISDKEFLLIVKEGDAL